MAPFANGWLLSLRVCNNEDRDSITTRADELFVNGILLFYNITVSSNREPYEMMAIFALSSQVTSNYLRRTLNLPTQTNLTISSPTYMNSNFSNTRFIYRTEGELEYFNFESSYNGPNDNILADTNSSSTSSSYSPSINDASNVSSTTGSISSLANTSETGINSHNSVQEVNSHTSPIQLHESDESSDGSSMSIMTVRNDAVIINEFNDEIANHRANNTQQYRSYQNNLLVLNRISGIDELHMGEFVTCHICTGMIIPGENIVRQGFICDNVSCGIIRIYHLACLHRWIWQENRVPYCHICREYPRT